MPAPAMLALLGAHTAAGASWTPADFPGAAHWWHGNAGVTLSGSDVVQYDDQIGSINLTPRASTYHPPTTTTVNGLTSLIFNGTTFIGDNNNDTHVSISQPHWQACLYQASSVPTAWQTIAQIVDSVTFSAYSSSGSVGLQAGGSWEIWDGTTALQTVVASWDGSSTTIWIDGTSIGLYMPGTNTNALNGAVILGNDYSGGGGFSGTIPEFVIGSGTLSQTDVDNFNTYCSLWGY